MSTVVVISYGRTIKTIQYGCGRLGPQSTTTTNERRLKWELTADSVVNIPEVCILDYCSYRFSLLLQSLKKKKKKKKNQYSISGARTVAWFEYPSCAVKSD